MMDFIDIYCERLGPGILAEPLNALTNMSFFVAAFFAYRLARQEDRLDWHNGPLIALTALMGLGSTLFHTFAVLWAMLADVLPILCYQIVFIAFYSRSVIGLKRRYIAVLLGLFFLLMYIFMQAPREWLNGSLEYAPAWLFLLGLSLWHFNKAGHEKLNLLCAVIVFTVSLAFRSMDMAVCESFALGTHFIWHILNGFVLYLATRAFILNARKE